MALKKNPLQMLYAQIQTQFCMIASHIVMLLHKYSTLDKDSNDTDDLEIRF